MMMTMWMLFMIPLFAINTWINFQISIILIMVIYMFCYSFNFSSMLTYSLGVDFLSYGLVMLSLLIISLMVLSTNLIKLKFNSMFMMTILLLCFCLIMIFSSLNLIIMYIYFEFSLIPLLIMIFGWGYSPERLISGLYLFFYTLFASLPLLLFFINLYLVNGSVLFFMPLETSNSFIINLCMLLAFLVKFPMYMFHFWLPKAHVQSPVFGSMILAGLLLKIGGYGMFRVLLLNEKLSINYSFIWFSLSLMGAILVSLICLIQGDVKCMIAYSSVAHMSMCIMGIMTMTKWGMFGSYMLMLSHGLCSSGMFCLINISYERYSSRSFFINKGLINLMPSMSMFWFLFCAFNMGCPPSLNFISEIFIITSMMQYWLMSMVTFMFISFLCACFSYYLYSYTNHGNFHYMYCSNSGSSREYLMLTMHLMPMLSLLFSFNMFFV